MRTLDDRSLSFMALALVAVLGWHATRAMDGGAPRHRVRPAAATLPASVAKIATAIATTEGYFAPGPHDGRSLPYRLNNPGALKRTAIDARELQTWEDTGLLVFPTAEWGWAALHYQVCLMLTGASRIYEPEDTLHAVGIKYADGDRNWGASVAARLGVSNGSRLADLAGDAGLRASTISCREIASAMERGSHAPHADVVD